MPVQPLLMHCAAPARAGAWACKTARGGSRTCRGSGHPLRPLAQPEW